jgi:hypothetical protein
MDVAASRSLARHWLPVAIVLCALVFIGIPIWELIVPGPFDWHVQTEPFWQGGLEALALIALVATGLALNRLGWLVGLVAIPSVLYLRRHAVDAPLLLDVLYLEIVIGLGMSARRLLRLPPAAASLDYLLAFASGFAIWSAFAWSASALDLGSQRALCWLTLLLAIPAAFGGHRPLVLYLWRRAREQPLIDRIWCGLLAAWLLVLFARSRVAIHADAPWYGLRGQYVLVPGNSVYEALGLTSPVHYYPKIYELFLLPLNVLRDYSAIDAMSILLLLLLLLVCRLLLREIGTPAPAQLPLLALVATLPALANIATSPTPDLFSTLFILLGVFFALHVVRRKSAQAIAWMLTCVALGCSGKLTAIPFAGILLLATAIAAAAERTRGSASNAEPFHPRLAWTTLGLAIVAATFVLARTLLLSGLPTIGPDPLFNLWLALGFNLKEPAGTLPWTAPQDWSDVPSLVLDWLFRPQVLPHIVITWTGNVWLWLALLALAAAGIGLRRDRSVDRIAWPQLALMATGLGLAVGNRYLVRGGDGNYFLLALLPAIVCSGNAAFSRLKSTPHVFAVALACVPMFVLFQASYSFVSGAWTPGTRAVDLELSNSPRGTRKKRQTIVAYHGLSRIADYLGTLPHNARGTGAVEPAAQFWLPARFEDLRTISYSRPEYVADARSIRHFLRMQRIDYMIVPLPGVRDLDRLEAPTAVAQVAEQLAGLPGVRRIDDRRYCLLDLGGIDPAVLDPVPVARAAQAASSGALR